MALSRKLLERVRPEAERTTPRPKLLCWCVREALYKLYGWRPPL